MNNNHYSAGITKRALVISGALGLLVALLSNIVANLIRVPAGWGWLPIVVLVVTFILTLYIQLKVASRVEGRRNVSLKDVRVKEKSEIRNISGSEVSLDTVRLDQESHINNIETSNGKVSLENVQVKDGSKISGIETK